MTARHGAATLRVVHGDEEKIGRPWADAELDAIVADYFAMLDAKLAGRAYVKSHHSKLLMERRVDECDEACHERRVAAPAPLVAGLRAGATPPQVSPVRDDPKRRRGGPKVGGRSG